MKLYFIALVISVFYCGLIILLTEINRKEMKVNCAVAQFSPDYGHILKNRCKEKQ